MRKIRIGSGAGYAGDRIEPAVELIKEGKLDYICFECLAERTIALANKRKLGHPDLGYDEFLVQRMEKILSLCVDNQTKLISNMGAANPEAAVEVIRRLAIKKGLHIKVAAVLGDDILDHIDPYLDYEILERKEPLRNILPHIVSANAYLGADGIVEALKQGADIVITGRVADPSLFLAPLMYEFGWDRTDMERIGLGILCGHLMECSSQVCGGYFADPGFKDVENLAELGFPFADVDEEGRLIIGKLDHTGGLVSEATVKEQILYEIQDPSAYFTPDGTADFSKVEVQQIDKNRVSITNAKCRADNGKYKVSIGYKDGFLGEGQISYGGPGCYQRAKVAGEILQERLKKVGIHEVMVDYIGLNSLFHQIDEELAQSMREIRLRVLGKTNTFEEAQIIGNEVEALYLNGPAGGGGAEKSVRETIAIGSIFVDRKEVPFSVKMLES